MWARMRNEFEHTPADWAKACKHDQRLTHRTKTGCRVKITFYRKGAQLDFLGGRGGVPVFVTCLPSIPRHPAPLTAMTKRSNIVVSSANSAYCSAVVRGLFSTWVGLENRRPPRFQISPPPPWIKPCPLYKNWRIDLDTLMRMANEQRATVSRQNDRSDKMIQKPQSILAPLLITV